VKSKISKMGKIIIIIKMNAKKRGKNSLSYVPLYCKD